MSLLQRTGDEDVELWEGEEVVKGQPGPRHECLRAALVAQLRPQLPEGIGLYTSSSIEVDGTSPRSDLTIFDNASGETLVWVEVISPGDLQPGDARLTGRRRIDWLLAHGARSVWAFLDALDELMLVVFSSGTDPRHHAAPERTELPVPRSEGDLTVALDLGQLAREVASAPERW